MVVSTAAGPQSPSKPRVISEVKKMKLGFTTSLQDFGKPKISGQLVWHHVSQSKWHLRAAEVRNGSLFVFKNGSSGVEFRLPLRQLSLKPCNAPRTFCLTQGQEIPLVTFQALTDEEYEKWVKVLAVELIRQTPLQDLRFLDIISITRKRESEGTSMRRGRSEECLMLMDEGVWDAPLNADEQSSDFSRDRRYRSLTMDASTCEQHSERRQKTLGSRYNFKSEVKKRGKKSERISEDVCDGTEDEVDAGKAKSWAATMQMRGSLPRSEKWSGNNMVRWSRTQSVENIKNLGTEIKFKEEKTVSDESGISSGDENNNTILEADAKAEGGELESYSFVSVMEKKKFFESLSSDAEGSSTSPAENMILTRSNSIGDLKTGSEESTKLRRKKRTKSLHDLSRTPVPVREICRLFEPQSEEHEDGAIEEESEGNGGDEGGHRGSSAERNAILVLNQRRLQRGERKLARLRVQIAEVEETIKVIADDLEGIASSTLKRRESVEIFAALQRRLGEENSRLERLQEETSRVIKENQRTIMKLKKCEEK